VKGTLKRDKTIVKGLHLVEPNAFVPWKITTWQLKRIFKGYPLDFVTFGYYTSNVLLQNDLRCMIGFHFEPSLLIPRLHLFEFFRGDDFYRGDDYERNLDDSFLDFQEKFELAFGKPHSCNKGQYKFNDYTWLIGNITIIHNIHDRFGFEEHLMIQRNPLMQKLIASKFNIKNIF